MARIFKKDGKPFLITFIIISALVIVLSLCFMTQYRYFPTEASSRSLAEMFKGVTMDERMKIVSKISNLKKRFKLINDLIFVTGVISFVFIVFNSILNNYRRRRFYQFHLVTGIVFVAIPAVFSLITLLIIVITIPTFNNYLPYLLAEADYLQSPFPVSGFTLYVSIFILLVFIGICALNILFFINRFKLENLEEKAVETNE